MKDLTGLTNFLSFLEHSDKLLVDHLKDILSDREVITLIGAGFFFQILE